MSTKIVTPATFEPVSLSDITTYLRIDTNDDDAYLNMSLTICRRELEQHLRLALCQQIFESVLQFDLPPYTDLSGWLDYTSGKIELPFPPVQVINQASIETQPGTWTVMDSSTYYIDTTTMPGAIWIQATAFSTLSLPVWSVWSEPFFPRIKVNYTAGYSAPGLIPQEYKDMLLELVAFKYDNREGSRFPQGIEEKIKTYRNYLL